MSYKPYNRAILKRESYSRLSIDSNYPIDELERTLQRQMSIVRVLDRSRFERLERIFFPEDSNISSIASVDANIDNPNKNPDRWFTLSGVYDPNIAETDGINVIYQESQDNEEVKYKIKISSPEGQIHIESNIYSNLG